MGRVIAIVVAILSLVSAASAGTITITNTFDLGQSIPVGAPGPAAPAILTNIGGTGLTVMGVTFSFTEGGSGFAVYGDTIGTGGLSLTYLSDPVLDGPGDGTLTLQFADPTTFLQFGAVVGSMSLEVQGVTIALTGPNGFSATQYLSTAPGSGPLSEGQYTYNDLNNPITQAVLTFTSDAGTNPFALDNLTYNVNDLGSPDPAPEPASLTLLGCGILLVGAVSLARRRCAA